MEPFGKTHGLTVKWLISENGIIPCNSGLGWLFCLQMIERFNGRMPGYLGNGNDRFSLCHIDDVVVGHLAAINVGKIGERYLLCGENISLTHIFNLAASLTNTAPPKFQLPYWILECAGRLCELWSTFGAWSGISHQTPFITSHVSYPSAACLNSHDGLFAGVT